MLKHAIPPFYRTHIFICTHTVAAPTCCGQRGGMALCLHARHRVRELRLDGVCVSQSGCMGRCMSGPALVIYPDNVWYNPQSTVDIDAIIEGHLRCHIVVENLRMSTVEPPLPGYDNHALQHSDTMEKTEDV